MYKILLLLCCICPLSEESWGLLNTIWKKKKDQRTFQIPKELRERKEERNVEEKKERKKKEDKKKDDKKKERKKKK